jgi:predicted nucleic acid-binding protein
MTVVCDTGPLIFLAKLNRLDLISALLRSENVVLDCVKHELLSKNVPPVERDRLQGFLRTARTPRFTGTFSPSRFLSRCDQATLSWAVKNHADWLVADERLLRRVAREQGIAVVGFCGLLVGAVKKGILTSKEVRTDIDSAVSQHNFHISIRLYQEILRELGEG